VRVNFNYFISERQFEFLLAAIDWVAQHGWKLLPHYVFDEHTGQWTHRGGRRESALQQYLGDADRIVAQAVAAYPLEALLPVSTSFEALRWFVLPGEVLRELTGRPAEPRTELQVAIP
jgi:hypothetical protein